LLSYYLYKIIHQPFLWLWKFKTFSHKGKMYKLNLTKFCPRKKPDFNVLASLLNNPLRKCRLSIMTKSVWGCDKENITVYIKRASKQCHSKLGSSEVPPRFRVEHFRSNLNACCWRSCEHPLYLRRHKICLDWYGVHDKLKCKHIPRFVNDQTTQRSLFVQKLNFIEVNFQVWYRVVPLFLDPFWLPPTFIL
jgi:hypothetical protein